LVALQQGACPTEPPPQGGLLFFCRLRLSGFNRGGCLVRWCNELGVFGSSPFLRCGPLFLSVGPPGEIFFLLSPPPEMNFEKKPGRLASPPLFVPRREIFGERLVFFHVFFRRRRIFFRSGDASCTGVFRLVKQALRRPCGVFFFFFLFLLWPYVFGRPPVSSGPCRVVP